jgi:hypothetical protein
MPEVSGFSGFRFERSASQTLAGLPCKGGSGLEECCAIEHLGLDLVERYAAAAKVDLGVFGPIGASLVEVLRLHFATVFGLIPWRRASALMLS